MYGILTCTAKKGFLKATTNGFDKSDVGKNVQEKPFNPKNDISMESSKAVKKIVQGMSLEEKIYQLLILPVSGNSKANIRTKHFKYAPGAVILFKFNLANKAESVQNFIFSYVKSFDQQYRETASPHVFRKTAILPFFALDNEGGPVFRTAGITSKVPSAYDVAKNFEAEEAERLYALLAEQMRAMGISMNLAPVCETGNAKTGVLEKRYFSEDAQKVSDFASAFVNAHEKQQIATVLKHFPNSGNDDTHKKASRIDGTYTEFLKSCESFKKPLKNSSGIMLSHSIVTAISELPFCLSKPGIDFLKNNLNYDGLIISDDIVMKALEAYGKTYSDLAFKLLMAGCDFILYSASDFPKLVSELMKKANNEPSFERRVNNAVCKILSTKIKLGLIDNNGNNLLYTYSPPFDAENFYKIKDQCDKILNDKGF